MRRSNAGPCLPPPQPGGLFDRPAAPPAPVPAPRAISPAAQDRGPKFGGATFDAARDGARLTGQLVDIAAAMAGGGWHTLAELHATTGHPEASVSARLRDLRKPRNGGRTVQRRRRGPGTHEYRLVPR